MENLLDLYERPLDPREPVVGLDEKPVQLLKECRGPIRADKPGKIMKRDSEYVRNGTANVFCVVEPKAGRHLTAATKNRKGPEFAKTVGRIARAYPKARTIHLVMDNLSTHGAKALRDYYGEERGEELWERFRVHYTPKHGSWLNQAEIECGLFGRRCLGKDRVGDLESLQQRTQAWNTRGRHSDIGGDAIVDARPLLGCGFVVRRLQASSLLAPHSSPRPKIDRPKGQRGYALSPTSVRKAPPPWTPT
ncbi:MAG: IS630 family transposase [Elusimicrobia bacterium]|nr:IS630 family transposase [Elusimicrobiota bacterium]